MKKILLLLLLFPAFIFAENVKPKPSKIERVTVYLEGASIERTATVMVIPGANELLFDNLSPDIEESSIQISGLEKASILALKFNIDYLDKKVLTEEYKGIEATIDALELKKASLENTIYGFEEELQLLQKNQRINSDATDLSLQKVKETATYYRQRVTEIKNEIFALRLEIVTINEQFQDYGNELAKLADTKQEKRGEISVKIDAPVATSLTLKIKYKINNAGWFPFYDLRASNTSSPIDLSYKANIYQQSGTDWNDVQLVLSTGDPNTDNTKPELLPKYLNFTYGRRQPQYAVKNMSYKYNPTIRVVSGTVLDDSGVPLPGVNVIEQGTSNGTQTDFEGNYTLHVNGGRELVYSYVGFESTQMPIHSSLMNVSLNEDQAVLQEVVVTGSSRARGSRDPLDVNRLLAGKAAGVQILNSSGFSGANSTVRIRGMSSNSTSDLLYVIDGIPGSEYNFNKLNPDDISSVSVLKGASATSIYGSRGVNGVMLIATKGKTGSAGVSKETGLTAVRFEIDKKYTINSNAEITVVEIDKFALPATYQHYAAPELNENVFLTATIKDWEQYDLLQGEANIYFEGNYAGKTQLDPFATADSLNVSLGVDPGVVVKREKIDNYKSKSFFGGNRIIAKGYKIEVKNNKKTPVALRLEDRIPISENKEIKIDDMEEGDANYNVKTGVLQWNLALPSNASSKKQFTYVVKYPKGKQINL